MIDIELNPIEARVLGCLIEKDMAGSGKFISENLNQMIEIMVL